MAEILTAAPGMYSDGTQDLSRRTVPIVPLQIPQHLPKFYMLAGKGKGGPNYIDLDNASVTTLYGAEAFDVNGKYYKHTVPFIQAAVSAANNYVNHRIIPQDGKGLARAVLYIDYVEDDIIQYQRDAFGNFVLNSNGDKQPIMENGVAVTVPGHRVGWFVAEFEDGEFGPVGGGNSDSTDYEDIGVGTFTAQEGFMTNSLGVKSQLIPIFEAVAETPGEAANNLIMRLYTRTKRDTGFPTDLLKDGKQYPIYFNLSEVIDPVLGTTISHANLFGQDSVNGGYNKDGIHPLSGATSFIGNLIDSNYIDVPEEATLNLGSFYSYDQNLGLVLGALKTLELAAVDIVTPPVDVLDNIETTELTLADRYSLNIISFKYSSGISYYSIEEELQNANYTQLTKSANLPFSGGKDGSLDLVSFEAAVRSDLKNYGSTTHEYNDLVKHPESILYDSGFLPDTKDEFGNFISLRYDTFVVMGNHVYEKHEMVGDPNLALSMATHIKTMLELHPESATYGTPVMRGTIMCGSSYILDHVYTKRVPSTYELCVKACLYMGAKNGAWRTGFLFDRAPLSVISSLKEVDIGWVPAGPARTNFWKAGLNFALSYELRRQFFPALRTVYNDDTSVLNSFFTVVAIAYLNKVAYAAWKEFSGSISLTNSQLEERVNEFVSEMVKDKFDGLFVIIPRATVTGLDETRGYSWTLPIDIYANNMKTVMTTNVNAYRLEDLAE